RTVREPVCSDERYYGQRQIHGQNCTAFLVAPDKIGTAGHCTDARPGGLPCASMAFAFDYKVTGRDHDPTRMSLDKIYRCASIEYARLVRVPNSRGVVVEDSAIIKLDRPVEGVEPLLLQSGPGPTSGAEIAMIGAPSALPIKWAPNGRVRVNPASTLQRFQ